MSELHTAGKLRWSRLNWRGEPDPHHIYITGNHREADEDDEDGRATCVAVARVEGNATSHPVTEEDARRLVACWNACLGLPTAMLERLDRVGIIAPLIEQKNALLAACEAAESIVESACHEIGGERNAERVLTMIREAIRHANGE